METPTSGPASALDQAGAAAFLWAECGVKCSPMTLRKLRCVGGGPPFYKVMSRVFYDRDGLRAWGFSRRSPVVNSTSELPSRHTAKKRLDAT